MVAKAKKGLVGRDAAAAGSESMSLDEQEAAADEAAREMDDAGEDPTEQAEEQADAQTEMPVEPQEPAKKVRKGHMLVKFVRVKVEKEKEKLLLGLEISFALDEAHEGKLPKQVQDCWDYVKGGNSKRDDILNIPHQTIELRLTPDDEGPVFSALGMEITNATMSLIEEKGSGKAEDVIRFSFVAWMRIDESNKHILWWAATHMDNAFWMKLRKTQGSLLEKD